MANPLTWAGHAALIIEGRDKGTFFKYKAHLKQIQGQGKVILQKYKEGEKVLFSEKGNTWIIHATAVKRMLDVIRWEKKKQKDKNFQIYFDPRGSKSKFVSPIVIQEYASYKELIKKTLESDQNCHSSSLEDSASYSEIKLRNKFGKKWKKKNSRVNSLQFPFSQQRFIQNEKGKWFEVRVPDNCMTWAKRKLRECGIFLKNKSLDPFFASPKEYVVMRSGMQNSVRALIDDVLEKCMKKMDEKLGDGDLWGKGTIFDDCVRGDSRSVSKFIKQIGDLNLCTEFEKRNLMCQLIYFASRHNHEYLVEFLLQSGANVKYKDESGNTILHYLAQTFCLGIGMDVKIPEMILTYGANVNAQRDDGKTPLMCAIKNNRRMARFFLRNGASLDLKDMSNRSALWYACDNENEEMVHLLIEYGVDLIAATNDIHNPFELVKRRGLQKIESFMNQALEEQRKKLSVNEKNSPNCLVS